MNRGSRSRPPPEKPITAGCPTPSGSLAETPGEGNPRNVLDVLGAGGWRNASGAARVVARSLLMGRRGGRMKRVVAVAGTAVCALLAALAVHLWSTSSDMETAGGRPAAPRPARAPRTSGLSD